MRNRGESFYKNDPKRMHYIREVQRGKSKEFLKDVAICAKYKQKPSDFKGKCGKVLCSKEYIDHMEHHVFGRNVSDYYLSSRGDTSYGQGIKKALENVARQIEKDFDRIKDVDDEYLFKIHKDNLISEVKALGKCGVHINSKAEKICKELPDLIEYLNKDEIKTIIKKYANDILIPKTGVRGIGLGQEVGIGWYTSKKIMFVWDAIGNCGAIYILGIGGGFGISIGVKSFHFKNMKDIFELKSKNIADLGASASVEFGPLEIGGDFMRGEQNIKFGAGEPEINQWKKMLNAGSILADLASLSVTANAQLHFTDFLFYKQVIR